MSGQSPDGPPIAKPLDQEPIDLATDDDDDIVVIGESWRQNLTNGSKLEAQDKRDLKFYEVTVLKKSPNGSQVFVHYNGYTKQYDEWIPIDDNRLRPLQQKPQESVSPTTPQLELLRKEIHNLKRMLKTEQSAHAMTKSRMKVLRTEKRELEERVRQLEEKEGELERWRPIVQSLARNAEAQLSLARQLMPLPDDHSTCSVASAMSEQEQVINLQQQLRHQNEQLHRRDNELFNVHNRLLRDYQAKPQLNVPELTEQVVKRIIFSNDRREKVQFIETGGFARETERVIKKFKCNKTDVMVWFDNPIDDTFLRHEPAALSKNALDQSLRQFVKRFKDDFPCRRDRSVVVKRIESHEVPQLVGQRGVYAKRDIRPGEFLGRYIGCGLTDHESHKIWNKRGIHSIRADKYAFGADEHSPAEFVIDPYLTTFLFPEDGNSLENVSNFCLFVNDCRRNLTQPCKPADLKRQNAKFLWVLVRGQIQLYLVAVRRIRRGDEIFVNYGDDYPKLMQEGRNYEELAAQTQANLGETSVGGQENPIIVDTVMPALEKGDDDGDVQMLANQTKKKKKRKKRSIGEVMDHPNDMQPHKKLKT